MQSTLNVQVFNYKGQRMDSARVELIDRNKKSSALGYNKQFGYFETSVKETGIYTLKASATNLESQSREITIQTSGWLYPTRQPCLAKQQPGTKKPFDCLP